MTKPKRLSRKIIYEHPWVNLYVDQVQFPGGRVVDQHHLLDFGFEAAAAIIRNDDGHILLVQAYRYTTNSIEWEIPAGGIEPGESVIEAARREAREEAAYDTTAHELIYTYYPMNGMTNKVFHLVRCRATDQMGDFDPNEVKSVRWFSPTKVRQMIATNEIRDGYTLTGLLLELGR